MWTGTIIDVQSGLGHMNCKVRKHLFEHVPPADSDQPAHLCSPRMQIFFMQTSKTDQTMWTRRLIRAYMSEGTFSHVETRMYYVWEEDAGFSSQPDNCFCTCMHIAPCKALLLSPFLSGNKGQTVCQADKMPLPSTAYALHTHPCLIILFVL